MKLLTILILVVLYNITTFGQVTGETINLGLYGGKSVDLTYCITNNRLFAAVETPASLFNTDDSCTTWTQPFPIDSLEYNSSQQGWDGGANEVLSNLNSNSMITFSGLPGEFIPDLENGSTILNTTTGLYKLVENRGSLNSTWNGKVYWSNAANWSHGIPGYLDNAVFNAGMVIISGVGEINKLSIIKRCIRES